MDMSQNGDTPIVSLYCKARWVVCSGFLTRTHLDVIAEYDQSRYEQTMYEAGLVQNHLLYRLERIKRQPALRIHWQLQASHSRHSPTPSHRMSRCTAFCNAPDWRKAMCFQWGRGSGELFQPGVNTIREWEGVAPCCTYWLWETHGLCNQFIVNPIFVRQDLSNKLPSVDHGWYSYGGFLKWVYPKPRVSVLSHSLILDDWG